MDADTEVTSLDLIWGVAAIAKLIGRSQRQVFHMCTRGELPVRKIGSRWVASRKSLRAFFEGEAA